MSEKSERIVVRLSDLLFKPSICCAFVSIFAFMPFIAPINASHIPLTSANPVVVDSPLLGADPPGAGEGF